MTAAQESFLGRFLKQLDCGIAKGVFQMEMATYQCLHDNYIRYHSEIGAMLLTAFRIDESNVEINMCGNLIYQIVIARLNYRRKPGNIPQWDDTLGLAHYYKKYWNTEYGAATIKEVLRNFKKYA